MAPNVNLETRKGPTVTVSNIRDIAFYGCSEIILTENFTIFTAYATSFGEFTVAFHIFELHRGNKSIHVGPSEKVGYL